MVDHVRLDEPIQVLMFVALPLLFLLATTIVLRIRHGTEGNMKVGNDALDRDLSEIAKLLRKYQRYGHASVVDEILATLKTPGPDYTRLCGIDMWGGAGAVWEAYPSSLQESDEAKADKTAFRGAFVRLADTMNQMGIGTDRSRFIRTIFQSWLDKGL
jgi:hypothetical protein